MNAHKVTKTGYEEVAVVTSSTFKTSRYGHGKPLPKALRREKHRLNRAAKRAVDRAERAIEG